MSDENKKEITENNIENNVGIEAKYYPVEPIDPNQYTVQQYLFDTNTLLTQIVKDQKIIIEYLLGKEQEKRESRKLRTIGVRND